MTCWIGIEIFTQKYEMFILEIVNAVSTSDIV